MLRKNQVLDPDNLPNAMQSYVQALGLLDKGFATTATTRTALPTRKCRS